MDLVKAIIDYRARNNLSQKAMAERIGMTQNGLQKIEWGESKPRATTVSKIEQLLEKEKERNDK